MLTWNDFFLDAATNQKESETFWLNQFLV